MKYIQILSVTLCMLFCMQSYANVQSNVRKAAVALCKRDGGVSHIVWNTPVRGYADVHCRNKRIYIVEKK